MPLDRTLPAVAQFPPLVDPVYSVNDPKFIIIAKEKAARIAATKQAVAYRAWYVRVQASYRKKQ